MTVKSNFCKTNVVSGGKVLRDVLDDEESESKSTCG